MKKILVLCTGNSCRSILAEVLLNHALGAEYHCVSAGSTPTGYVHTQAIALLQEQGFSTEALRSKSWDEFAGQSFDVVITVCDNAAEEQCPFFPGNPERLHWSLPDPALVNGSSETVKAAFLAVFNQIKQHIDSTSWS